MSIIQKIEREQLKSEIAPFNVGDTVRVHTRVVEGDKERIQIFTGIVIGRRGTGLNANFTVRRISYGEGVERVFPLHSPRIAKIEVERAGDVRRSAHLSPAIERAAHANLRPNAENRRHNQIQKPVLTPEADWIEHACGNLVA